MSTRTDPSGRAFRHQQTLLLQNQKKQQLKGPVTKWEKKWVTVGHLKLLKWIALKPKKPIVGQNVSRTKENVTNKQASEPVSNTIRTRSKRGSAAGGDQASLVEQEMEMNYLYSLPKTRSNSRRIETIQKKLQQESATKDSDEASGNTTTTSTGTDTDGNRPNMKKKILLNKNTAGSGIAGNKDSVSSPSIQGTDSFKDGQSSSYGQSGNSGHHHPHEDDDDDDEEDDSKMEEDDDDEPTLRGKQDDYDDDDSDEDGHSLSKGVGNGSKATDSHMDDDDDEEGAY